MADAPDYIEQKTAELLTQAKRSGFFKEAIADAEFSELDAGERIEADY